MLFPALRLLARIGAVAAVLATVPAAAQGNELQSASELLKQGQLERALERVEAHLKNSPRDARGRFLKGLILTEQRKPDDAIKVFMELTQEFPELPEPYNNLAVLYASQGQYEKARSALEMAIRAHPSYATAHENLGDIHAKLASQAYDNALQLDKANAPLQIKLKLINDIFAGNARLLKPNAAAPAARPAPTTPPAMPPQNPSEVGRHRPAGTL